MKRIILVVLLGLCLMSLMGCSADISTQSLTEFKDYKSYFGDVEGSFVLYQNKLNKYWMYNGNMCFDPASPDSTYKIVHTLIGLDLGLLPGDAHLGKWDQMDYGNESWNKDQTLESAFQNSVVWYYKRLARKIDSEDLTRYMEDINYGNKDVSGPRDEYWLESTLKITPVEQVELLRKLYIKVLPFSEENQVKVKELMFLGQYGASKLYGKTGSGDGVNAWFIGFVEKEGTAYCFATRIKGEAGMTGEKAKAIAIQILKSEALLGK